MEAVPIQALLLLLLVRLRPQAVTENHGSGSSGAVSLQLLQLLL
jgi:hypothetical protein